MILTGKRIVVTGVATKDSIAYAVAEEAQRAGAEVVLTSFGRMRSLTERAARRLPDPADVLELDVTRPEHFEELARELDVRWGAVDGVAHGTSHRLVPSRRRPRVGVQASTCSPSGGAARPRLDGTTATRRRSRTPYAPCSRSGHAG